MAVNPSDCRNYLQRLAARDRFLSTVDQQPQLDALMRDLSAAIDEALAQGHTDLAAIDESLDNELLEVAGNLASSRELLTRAFEQVRSASPLQSEDLVQLSRTIEARILWLYDRVRVRQERSLNQVRPQNRSWNKILQHVAEAIDHALRNQPEELTLIRDRQQQQEPGGRSIWQIEAPPLIQTACTGSSRLTTRLTFARLRYRLGRRYQILQPVVQDAFTRHRPAMLQPDQKPLEGDYVQRHEQVSHDFSDMWRGLRFNLETAAEDCHRLAAQAAGDTVDSGQLQQQLTETGKLVTEVLERTEQQLAPLADPLKELSHQLLERLENECREMLDLIPKDLQRVLSRGERLTHKRRRLLRTWRRNYTQFRKDLQPLMARLDLMWQFLVQGIMGLRPGGDKIAKSESMLRSIADLPTPEAILQRAGELPPVCRRMFTSGALKNREFMIGKNKDLDTLRELFKRWQEGLLCSIAVTGPDGSGKTSLVNCFQSELGTQWPVLRFSIDSRLTNEPQLLEACRQWLELAEPPADLDAVEAYLNNLPRGVIIVENLHNLLLRTVGGLDVARAFLRLVLASRHRQLWVVTVRKYPWHRMRYLLTMDRYFTHQVHTLFNSQSEIRDALLLRVHTSSYPVTFLNGQEEAISQKPATGKDEQTSRQDRFFADLFAATRGNMQAALYYWLMNLEYDEQQQTLLVSPMGKIDYGPLRSLDRAQLYALAEVIAHGGLSISEHATIFGGSSLQSRMLLDHLAQLNLLQYPHEQNPTAAYQLNPLFFAPITSLLESRNIIQ
ncbi:hypothetical protein Pcar_2714 [Syntrophotalea carbinolica DSM 2380]|uniref:Orc1-like AAA ATPase domain-containing protein n=1 Tax=Syntrophotalea carbinolica (strain DSM 2380 / NBRC 103641 / GraBd1) TaxID=338963 RepID=Q3A107_SYNC1|nr:hypothetical protein Pcar_2714 [Syntrophotalea carbinolica DSM 2380]